MIDVRLPASLATGAGAATLAIGDPVRTIGDLVDALDRRLPGFRAQLDDALFNFAVNDELVVHGVLARPLAPGDHVEIVPTIAGG